MNITRISKIAGIGFAGFVVATLVADKANAGPAISQVAGFLGGLLGSLAGRPRKTSDDHKSTPPAQAS